MTKTRQGEVYTGREPPTTAKPIEAAKEAVPVIDLADRLCGPGQMRRIGQRWVARCPLPGHDERTASFTVYSGGGGWYCYGCTRGGSVIDLAMIAWGIDRPDVAAAEVLMEFGHDVPARPASWYARQERQKPIRDAIDAARVEVLMRRLWRFVFVPILADIEDADERTRAGNDLWATVYPRARQLVEDRGRAT